ncbi:WG repeat-containing protein [Fluviicola taffensis]|uniref:KWG Leptospira repeat protein n=1 Tax=Fluviicola taffensis (strain DSM 16823 / NCIMB 13979 / RW262) TaxID=755732 RepID=F2IEK8_FLUTR|nr:WG repeat-containing protein [Fluviicola taffensis]AEA44547.1 hypothetical protein Fluta_2562 [Fluviicola taffensis DSM 16823]
MKYIFFVFQFILITAAFSQSNRTYFLDYVEKDTVFMEWNLKVLGDKTEIRTYFDSPFASFDGVAIPAFRDVYYDELNNGVEVTWQDGLNWDILQVLQKNGTETKAAFYDVRLRKYWTPWMSQKLDQFYHINFNNETHLFVFVDENGFLNYVSSNGQYHPVTTSYSNIRPASGNFLIVTKKEGEEYLAELKDSTIVERFPISSYSTSSEYGDPFYISIGTNSAFQNSFHVFKKGNGKFGIFTTEGKLIDLDADTLVSGDYQQLVKYYRGNSIGAVNCFTGVRNESEYLDARFMPLGEAVVRTGPNNEGIIDDRGRAFVTDYLEMNISKKGGYEGISHYSNYETEDGRTLEQAYIPYEYKKLNYTLLTDYHPEYILAQNKSNKWGIIDGLNTTVYPFQYDEIQFLEVGFPFREFEPQGLTRIGKLHGVIDFRNRKELPAVFDEVKFVDEQVFRTRKATKFGMVDYQLNEQLTPIFDELFVEMFFESNWLIHAQKDGKWYNAVFYEGQIPNQNKLLQEAPCDLVINKLGFIKTEKGYDVIDLISHTYIARNASPMDYLDNQFFQLLNNQIIIIDSKGKNLYKESFTNIHFDVGNPYEITSSKNGVKWTYYTLKKDKRTFVY